MYHSSKAIVFRRDKFRACEISRRESIGRSVGETLAFPAGSVSLCHPRGSLNMSHLQVHWLRVFALSFGTVFDSCCWNGACAQLALILTILDAQWSPSSVMSVLL